MALRVVEQAFASDTGRQREANEDSYFVHAPLFGVADGMGGAQAGEVASRIAAEAFEPFERGEEPPEAYLRGVVEQANGRIHSLAESDSARSGMGTTLTAALLEDDEISLAHVGDSRAYLFRDGELRMLTSDHSLVEELRRQGRLTDEQAQDHPQRSIITRALGPEPEVEIDTMTLRARPGDIYLICSDGLTTMTKDERIREVLASADSLDAAAKELVAEANAAGGRDNITIVAFRVEETGAPVSAAAGPTPEDGATLVGPAAEETAAGVRAARRARATDGRGPAPKPSRARTAAKILIPLVILALLVGGAIYGIRQIYFLGSDDGGRLALFRGLPYELPLGINLYSEVDSSTVEISSLPVARQKIATGHELRSHSDAVDLIDNLESQAVAPAPKPAANGGGNQSGGQPAPQGGGGQGTSRPGSGGGGAASGGGSGG
jgi:serine/threonine protein phosphatase PrpC